jgi:LacI family transcriptional regulator
MASNLRSRQSDLIGLVLPDITTTFWTTIARGVEDEAWSRGYSVFICNTDDDPDKEHAYVDRLLQRRVEGLIIAPSNRDNTRDLLNRVKLHQANIVVIHRSPEGIEANTVRTNGYQATRRLTEALIDRGSRQIAYLGMSLDDPISSDRLKGFREVMAERDIAIDEDFIVADPFHRGPGTYGIAFDLITRDPRPDAIVLGNSSVAVHALHAIQDAGLVIPQDIAVATFHDITSLDFYAPYLIRAVQPSYLMGRTAMQKLFEIGRNPSMPVEETVLMPEIHLPAGE